MANHLNPEEMDGKFIYKEGLIQINTFPGDEEAHNVLINGYYFVFPGGTLSEVGERTSPDRLARVLDAINIELLFVLKESRISPEAFALACARTRLKEAEEFASYLIQEANG
jgi:hypothetical protein